MKRLSIPVLAHIIFKPVAIIEPLQNVRFMIQRRFFNHYDYQYANIDDAEDIPIELYSDFGYVLKGNWYRRQSQNHRKVIFLVHGYASVKREMDYLAPFFFNLGFDVVSYNLYPYHQTQKLVTFGKYESEDLIKMYHGILEQQAYDVVGFFGHSLGAVAALHAASHLPGKIDFVISNSAFNKLDETLASHLLLHMQQRVSKSDVLDLARKVIAYAKTKWGEELFYADTQSATMMIEAPVLYVHGESDTMNPTYMTEELQNHTPHAYFTKLPRADHLETFILTKREIEMAMLDFLQKLNLIDKS